MSKNLFFISALIALGLVLPSCASSSVEEESSSSIVNTAPTILGVEDAYSIALGNSFNALEGVTGSDAEDGDITSSIVISSIPALVNNEGVLTPEDQGEYYLTYTLTDSGGLTSETYSTLTVTEPERSETVYQTYQFSENPVLDMKSWEVTFGETATGTYQGGTTQLEISISDSGTTEGDVRMHRIGNSSFLGSTYTFKAYVSSSVATTARIKVVDPLLGVPEIATSTILSVTSTPSVLELDFEVLADTTNLVYSIDFGGDLTTAATVISISKIEIVSSTGTEVSTPLLTDDFALNTTGWAFQAYAGSTATLTNTNQEMAFAINPFATENKPWNTNLYRATSVSIVSGTTYRLSMDIEVSNEQFYELCFEDSTMDWQIRAGFKSGSFLGTSSFSFTFLASRSITALYIKLALGQGTTTSNTITIDNFLFESVAGDFEISTEEYLFAPVDENSKWSTFNSNGGAGAIYLENEKLYYSITAFGATDWHNKLTFDSLTLTSMSSYRFEFTISADKALSGAFIVNEAGTWNPQVNETIAISTTETTLSFTTESDVLSPLDVELLFQFGGFASNVAPALICISALTVYQIA